MQIYRRRVPEKKVRRKLLIIDFYSGTSSHLFAFTSNFWRPEQIIWITITISFLSWNSWHVSDYWEDLGFAQQLPCFTQSMGLTGGFRGLHQSGARSVPRAGNAMPGSGWIHGRNRIPSFGQERRPQPTFNQYYFHYEIFDWYWLVDVIEERNFK